MQTPRCRTLPVSLALLAAGLPLPAASQLIDDFEAGSFSLSCTVGYCSATQQIGSHGMGPTRRVTLGTFNNITNVATLAGTPYDDALRVTGTYPEVWVEYDPPGNVDLTGGGIWDYIRILLQAPSQTQIIPSLSLASGGFDRTALVYPGSFGLTTIAWSDFGSLTTQDLQAVDHFDIKFHLAAGFLGAEIVVSDIRLGRSGFNYGIYENLIGSLTWVNGAGDEMYWEVLSDTSQPDYEIHLLPDAITGSNPTILIEGFDSGGDIGNPGAVAGTATFWDDPGTPYSTTTFDLRYDVYGSGRRPVLASAPVITVNDGTTLEYRYVVDVQEWGTSTSFGNVIETVTMDVTPGQPLTIDAVEVVQNSTDPPGFSVRYQLTDQGGVDTSLPLVSTMRVSDWETGTAATGAPSLPDVEGGGGASLAAHPSVTRGGSTLSFTRTRGGEGRVRILDVAGRMVRGLPVRGAAGSVFWDGADDRGVRAPAGVYFAVLQDREARTGTRIVRVP